MKPLPAPGILPPYLLARPVILRAPTESLGNSRKMKARKHLLRPFFRPPGWADFFRSPTGRGGLVPFHCDGGFGTQDIVWSIMEIRNLDSLGNIIRMDWVSRAGGARFAPPGRAIGLRDSPDSAGSRPAGLPRRGAGLYPGLYRSIHSGCCGCCDPGILHPRCRGTHNRPAAAGADQSAANAGTERWPGGAAGA